MKNAYLEGRRIQPGCKHMLGCKCEIPYHLRPSTSAEQKMEKRIRGKANAKELTGG